MLRVVLGSSPSLSLRSRLFLQELEEEAMPLVWDASSEKLRYACIGNDSDLMQLGSTVFRFNNCADYMRECLIHPIFVRNIHIRSPHEFKQ